MALFILDNKNHFPPVDQAEPDGLLAVGGDLSAARLLLAYRQGIFPWYDRSPIMWWSPDPRFVLYPGRINISTSMKAVMKKGLFEFSINRDFSGVIRQCQHIQRDGQSGTWITPEIFSAFTRLHELGYAHSAESWFNGELVGGLYGIRMGNVFFGESMFARVSNASKYAFIRYVRQLEAEGVTILDCQVYTEHLRSLGAEMISRKEFVRILANEIPQNEKSE